MCNYCGKVSCSGNVDTQCGPEMYGPMYIYEESHLSALKIEWADDDFVVKEVGLEERRREELPKCHVCGKHTCIGLRGGECSPDDNDNKLELKDSSYIYQYIREWRGLSNIEKAWEIIKNRGWI